jgi:CTP:molybdopterin cytidylyltransferase MocA
VKDGLRVVAVVPARGGTDRIPYLNIKRLGDRPLLAHTLDAARAASSVDRVVVSTDDDAVAEVAKGCGAEVPFVRPRELAEEINSLMPVVQHALREIERQGDRPDLVVLLQATTPFRDARAIDAAVARLVEGGFDSVVSVTEDRTLAWKDERGLLVPLFAEAGRARSSPRSTRRTARWWRCGARRSTPPPASARAWVTWCSTSARGSPSTTSTTSGWPSGCCASRGSCSAPTADAASAWATSTARSRSPTRSSRPRRRRPRS